MMRMLRWPTAELGIAAIVAITAVVAGACSSSSHEGPSGDGAPDADAADTDLGDPSPSDDTTSDGADCDQGCGDGEVTPDEDGDGGDEGAAGDGGDIDAGDTDDVDPLHHCTGQGTPPAWLTAAGAVHSWRATCASFDLVIEAYADGLLRLRYAPKGDTSAPRSWAVATPPLAETTLRVASISGGAEVCTPHYAATIESSTCRIAVRDVDGRVLLADPTGVVWEQGSELLDGVSVPTTTLYRSAPLGEHYYGFGERTGGALDKRGSHFLLWNTDAFDGAFGGYGPNADPLYQSIPFYIGLRSGISYGLLTDNPRRMEMDVARDDPSRIAVKIFDGAVDQYFFLGPRMADVLRRYTALTGRPALPPRWALGFHQSRWGYDNDTLVKQIADRFRADSVPAEGMWLDIGHLDGNRTFTWDPTSFSSPAALVDHLDGEGFKTIVIDDPGIKQEDGYEIYDEGKRDDYFLKSPNGQLFVGKTWPGPSVFPDFTLPAARAFWGRGIKSELARGVKGVRGIWLDLNEPTLLPESGGAATVTNDVIAYGDGTATTMAEVHNVYGRLEAQATFDAFVEVGKRPFILSRAGYPGIQRFAGVWTGDAPTSWDTLAITLPMMLNLGLSGEPLNGSDVGGYSGVIDEAQRQRDLYSRWMALGSISPFFRCHVTKTDGAGRPILGQEPWMYGSEVEDLSRNLINDRYRLLPYIYSLMAESTESGAPLLRPLVYEFPDDPETPTRGDEALLGPFILYAPILIDEAASRAVYLPAGRWYEVSSGAIYDGPTTVPVEGFSVAPSPNRRVTLAALPGFVREGAIIPRGPVMQYSDEKAVDPLSLDIYPASQASTFTLYEDAGDGLAYRQGGYSRVTYTLQQLATGASLKASKRDGSFVPAARRLVVRLHRADKNVTGVTLDGAALTKSASCQILLALASGFGFCWDDRDLSIVVAMADRDDYELLFTYDVSIDTLRPLVRVPFTVTVPAGTSTAAPVYVATSADWGHHEPLQWTSTANVASGYVELPRGEWFEYKLTRGNWDTVERTSSCGERPNRYGFASAHPMRYDQVEKFRDPPTVCP